MPSIDFTTGPATLPDVGELSYNGCQFSSLFETNVSGNVVKDDAWRTTKFMEYTLTADGYVTMPDTDESIEVPMNALRTLLTAQAGVLVYEGRGLELSVNQPGGQVQDVAWGPVPELLEFQPLGGGRSAKVKWVCKVRIPEVAAAGVRGLGPVLQFNEETIVSYDEAGYSTLSIRGTLEIPLTRIAQDNRTVTATVDDYRQRYMTQILAGIDLTRFRVVRREFPVSRDKRTMQWDFAAEEFPYMGLPPNVTVARGTYSFKPAKTGMGLMTWLCTLRVTYTVRADRARRFAWLAFLALLRVRMSASQNGIVPALGGNNQNVNALNVAAVNPLGVLAALVTPAALLPPNLAQNATTANARNALLIDFSGDEGLYLDSKTVTFSATWRLVTTFSSILVASGLWRKCPQDGGNTWSTSVRDISGWKGVLENRIDAAQDLIVDFGDAG